MAKAPENIDVANWDGSGTVWFKVYEISAVTNGGKSISWPSAGMHCLRGYILLKFGLGSRCHKVHLDDSRESAKWPVSSANRTHCSPQC